MKTELHLHRIEWIGRPVAHRWGLLRTGFGRSKTLRRRGQRKHGVQLGPDFESLSWINHGIERAWDHPILLKPPVS